MPRKPCYWTRKLELDLVEFVRQREFIWKPLGNTNHHIQQKYKAYAEFAAKLGRGFTARSVRDRWVNIRSTYNHNLRRVDKSKEKAKAPAEVYVPCWPLWKPLQFLREVLRKEDVSYEGFMSVQPEFKDCPIEVKQELQSDFDDSDLLRIRQRAHRTDRPRKRKALHLNKSSQKCMRVIDDLVKAMKPLVDNNFEETQPYWFFGKHVTERLNCMRDDDAVCASRDILKLLKDWGGNQCDFRDTMFNMT